jgi:predicted ATP-grasp superfamily ATP-dependent carboligase
MMGNNQSPEFVQGPRCAQNSPTPLLVLNVGQLALHHGGVGIIRSLGRIGVPVYAVVENRFTPAAVSKYLTGAIVWDTHRLDDQQFLDGMVRIARKLKRPAIVIPTGDVAAILVAEHAAMLERWFLLPNQPAGLPRTLANKSLLYRLCNRTGVTCPQVVFPERMDDVHDFAARATFPVVVKVAQAWELPEGERTTSITRTPEELYAICQELSKTRLPPNLILQDYVDPEHGQDWFYHGYCNPQTRCSVGFTGRKLRSYPAFAGPTTLGKSLPNARLRQQAESLLQAISYSGISDLDFRLDTRSGEYKLLDFNPRIGAQFRLFEDGAGVDVARALYLDLTGRRVWQRGGAVGRTFIAEFHDVAASLSYFCRGKLTWRAWRRSLRGHKELAWFSGDDPLPFMMMFICLLLRVAGRLLRKPWVSRGRDNAPRLERRAREATSTRLNGAVFSKLRLQSQESQLGVPQ